MAEEQVRPEECTFLVRQGITRVTINIFNPLTPCVKAKVQLLEGSLLCKTPTSLGSNVLSKIAVREYLLDILVCRMFTLEGILLVLLLVGVSAFAPVSDSARGGSSMKMNFLSGLFGPKQTAVARHILMDQKDIGVLNKLKEKIEKSGDVTVAFGQAAASNSKCPSSKKGGSLGQFGKGAMVPAFDKVVFNEATPIGEVQGPISTPFGVHLILVEERNSGN